MKVKLRVVHGMLQNRKGDDAGVVIAIRRSNFVIGSAEDANMRCLSKAISPHHCELTLDDEQVMVHDLESETGTFLNGDPLSDVRQLKHGDRIKVGRLEFEVEFGAESDPVSQYVSDLLEEGDEEARLQRLEDPQQRQFHPTPSAAQTDAETDAAADLPSEPEKTSQRPPKKPPGKLPQPKPIVAENTVDAATASLKRIFEKEKP
jgi:pSer/pThr/pTyr-binding forkhead associated (FHA) protein